MHTVLKRRHSLVGKNLLPLIRKLRQFKGERISSLARIKSTLVTEELPEREICSHFRDITGENEKEILELADREVTEANLRLLLHFTIIQANEVGQPTGQELRAVTPPEGDTDTTTVVPPTKKLKVAAEDCGSTGIQGDTIKAHKEKVRRLAMQNEPSEPLILLCLDELAAAAREKGHEDADMFVELAHQAHRHQGKVNLASLTLGVLGGKASDTVSKALSKCVKEKAEKKEESAPAVSASSSQMGMTSPLQGAYPSLQGFPPSQGYNFYNPYSYPYAHYMHPRPQRPRRGASAAGGSRPVGPCLFCDAMGHLVKDCLKLKAIKNNNSQQ